MRMRSARSAFLGSASTLGNCVYFAGSKSVEHTIRDLGEYSIAMRTVLVLSESSFHSDTSAAKVAEYCKEEQ
jgi:hypothetical protein